MVRPSNLWHQERLHELLAALWDGGRFGHALLFEGAPGIGKETLARHAAALLLCRGEGDRPCGECRSCRKLQSGNHPDLIVVKGDGKTKSIGVERIRALRADAYIAPQESDRRVFLLPEAQTLTPQAQNALLKLIEEPPAHACFLLTAPSRGGLLETVCSRLTVLPLQELDAAQRAEVLALLRPALDTETLRETAQGCETVGQALEALESPEVGRRIEDAARLLERALARDRYELLRLLAGYERDRDAFLRLLAALRERALSQLGGGDALRLTRIAAIIEKTVAQARQNVGLPLLSAVLAGRLAAL